MNTANTAFSEPSARIPPQAALGEDERDHLWWINDATRMVRTADWSALKPEHVCHLIEEVRDLAWLLDRDRYLDPPEPL